MTIEVQGVNINSGERLETYTVKGDRDTGVVCLNGPAGLKAKSGDTVTILSFASMTSDDAKPSNPILLLPDNQNKIV